MRELAYSEALVEALCEVMQEDERISLIGSYFLGLSPRRFLLDKLRADFKSRVIDPPISEVGFCGLGVGASLAGLRPIVDVGTASFIFNGWPMIVNEAANVHYMTGGQSCSPVVFHILHGLRGGGAAQHSHSPQAMLWNTPGLEIMLPSTPKDVKGLVKTAVKSNNPTIFVDHVRLFEVKGDVPDGNYSIPFGKADIKRKGKDVTIVATSFMVQRSLRVAEELTKEGIDVEVVDPRTLVPFDKETVLTSVEKTGHLVVVDECHKSCGVAAEISAIVAEEAFSVLKGPIKRVTTADVPVPFSPRLEAFIDPTEDKIAAAVRELVA